MCIMPVALVEGNADYAFVLVLCSAPTGFTRAVYIKITSWLVNPYDFYSRVVKDRLNERVSEANE